MARPKIRHIPNHVAIIMDGNGRWAKKRGLPRLVGHRAGVDNIRWVAECFNNYGVQYLTLFAFSTENWRRPQREVEGIIRILEELIDHETINLHNEGARLLHLGHLDGLPESLQKKVQYAIELTKHNTKGTLCTAFNYGGRDEIVDAAKRIVRDGIPPDKIDEALISS